MISLLLSQCAPGSDLFAPYVQIYKGLIIILTCLHVNSKNTLYFRNFSNEVELYILVVKPKKG